MASDEIVFFGDRGFVALAAASLRDFDQVKNIPAECTFTAALSEEDQITLVGASSRVGDEARACVVQIVSDRLAFAIRDTKALGLLAVAPWRAGSLQIQEKKTRPLASGTDVDLNALVVDRDDQGYLLGAGGHVFRLAQDGTTELERAGTQQDLRRAVRSRTGNLWAFADGGRILHRTDDGWPRVETGLSVSGSPLATWFGDDVIRVFYSDGTLVERAATAE
jgi:hypothetical protein